MFPLPLEQKEMGMHYATVPNRSYATAFTLIELLVVISIISLLVAILLPVLASARSRARQIKCLAQQKQYHLGMSMYADDSKGWYGLTRYSRPWQLFSDDGDAMMWENYLGATPNNFSKLLCCPDAKPMSIHSAAYVAGRVNSNFINTSYYLPGARGTYPQPSQSRYYYGWQGLWSNSSPEKPSAPVPNRRYVNGTYDGGTMSLKVGSPTVQPIIIDGYGPDGYWGNSIMSVYFNSHPSSTNMVFVDGHGVMRSNDEILDRHRGIHW
jgi:prepilin-type N-terminal cleavage/methylation domain-containing protein/prepilin-type processing-associated H-X9-DG protein